VLEDLAALQARWPSWAFDVLKLGNGLVLLALLFIPLERLFPQRPQPFWRPHWAPDLIYYFLNSLLPPKLIVLVVVLLVWGLGRILPHGLFPGLAALPFWPRFGLSLLVAELGFYWGHRWMHSVPWLWPLHAVHHSAEELSWLVNTRAHPLDLFVTRLCGLLPLYLLGLAQVGAATVDPLPVLIALVMSIWGYFLHANVRFRLAPLQRILATPAFHHWHHDNVGADGSRHRNFAALLPLMDMVFGTYHHAGAERPRRLGVDGPVPDGMIDQLLVPLTIAGRSPPP
jgi:sterol desaturase/sphingolipid hydroxylase (fatty acid hydroxylase superfamily)